MTHFVLTLSEDDTLHHAARMLLEHPIGALPVLSASGEPSGILSTDDSLRAFLEQPELSAWK